MVGDQKRYVTRETRSILGAFNTTDKQLISLVGGGGKTSTMNALAKALLNSNYTVITTTTTHIRKPSEEECPYTYILKEYEDLDIEAIRKLVKEYKHITILSGVDKFGKGYGLQPDIITKIFEEKVCDTVICEADGSAQRPIKCPRESEPVFPAKTNVVIPVVGLDALGASIGSDMTFRNEYICNVTGLNIGDILDENAIAKIVTNEKGIIQYAPENAIIIPFLNKIDLISTRSAIEVAKAILGKNHPQINYVVTGSIQDKNRIFTIVQKL